MRDRFVRLDLRFTFDSFRRDLKRPGEGECDWKSNREDDHEDLHRRRWRIESRKENRRCLDQEPRDDQIGGRDFVNVAPLQFGKEIVDLHFFGSITFFTSAWKRGSAR